MEAIIEKALEGLTLYDLILFLVSGFVFVNVFDFTIEVDRQTRKNHNPMVYLIIGFVLNNAVSIIAIQAKNSAFNVIGFIIICVLLGYISGMIYYSNCFSKLLDKLKIRSTPQNSIWGTITRGEKSLWVEMGFQSLNLRYYGIAKVIEDGQRFPQIALYGYIKGRYDQILKEPNNPDNPFLEDFSGDLSKFVLLNTEKADYIELVSTNQSRNKSKRKQNSPPSHDDCDSTNANTELSSQ